MNFKWISLPTCSLLATIACAQQTKAPRSPYSAFLGCWTGTSTYTQKGVARRDDLLLTISENPSKHEMIWDFNYEPTADAVDHIRKFLQFDLVKKELEMHNDGVPKERWATSGFEALIAAGKGSFTATESRPNISKEKRRFRLSLNLTANHLSYAWEVSDNGTSFQVYSEVQTERAGGTTGRDCVLPAGDLPEESMP